MEGGIKGKLEFGYKKIRIGKIRIRQLHRGLRVIVSTKFNVRSGP